MIKVFLFLGWISSCAFLGLYKFDASNTGLEKAIDTIAHKIRACSQERVIWHRDIEYKVVLSVLLNTDGKTDRIYLESHPALTDSLHKCLGKVFMALKFKEPIDKKSKRITHRFKIKAL